MRRAEWLAFLPLAAVVNSYDVHREHLTKLNVSMEDWIGYDDETRTMKIKTKVKD